MSLLAQARNLLMIYLSLEFVGLLSYLLVGFVRNSIRSSEAALKYVLFGAVASGVFLFGASIFYGLTGSLDIAAPLVQGYSAAHIVAGIFMLGGFLFKLAAVPMQAWCPDVYEGAPTPITALLSVAPKAAGFAVLMRVSQIVGLQFSWPVIIAVVSAVTMTFGNLAAIPQMNVKRLLAYSSIAHAGYLLMGIACATPKGYEAVYFYFVAYLLMNLGAFLVVQIMSNKTGTEEISAFAGLARSGPFGAVVAIAMTIFLLSLTGVPPFVGFIGKFYLFSAVIDAKIWWLAIVGIANSVVSLYYYMRIVKAMFFDAAPSEYRLEMDGVVPSALLATLSIMVVVFGLAWSWIAQISRSVAL
jgi:NADH-quinone oxidoreductase subunit N